MTGKAGLWSFRSKREENKCMIKLVDAKTGNNNNLLSGTCTQANKYI